MNADTGGLGPGGNGGIANGGGDAGYSDTYGNQDGAAGGGAQQPGVGWGTGPHGGYGGRPAPPTVESFWSEPEAPEAPAAPEGEIAGPPATAAGGNQDDTDDNDLFNRFFDPNKFYGPPDPLNEKAVKSVAGGLLTANKGFLGFREKLVYDPNNPDKVKAEITFDPLGALSDLVEGAIGFALGGPIGFVAGTAAGRLTQLATDPTYTLDQAVYDATNPFGIRDQVADPTSPVPSASDLFGGITAGGVTAGGAGGYHQDDRDGVDPYAGIDGTAVFSAVSGAGSESAAAGSSGSDSGAPGGTDGGGAVIDTTGAGQATASQAWPAVGAPASSSKLPELIVAGALAVSLAT